MKNHTLIILGYMLFLNVSAQQETYVFDPLHTNQILTELNYSPTIYEVNKKDLTNVFISRTKGENNYRTTSSKVKLNEKESFVIGKNCSADELSGSFGVIAAYSVMASDYDRFLKGELVGYTKVKFFDIPEKYITLQEYEILITNKETGKLYYVKPDFLEKFNHIPNDTDLADNTATNRINKSVVSQSYTMAYTIENYKNMILSCRGLTAKLMIYNRMAKNNTLSKKEFKNWKRDLVEAKLLNFRIDEFISAYDKVNYPFKDYVNKELLDNYADFSSTLTNATIVSGL